MVENLNTISPIELLIYISKILEKKDNIQIKKNTNYFYLKKSNFDRRISNVYKNSNYNADKCAIMLENIKIK